MTAGDAIRAGLAFMVLVGLSACASPRENLYVFRNPAADVRPPSADRITVLLGPVTVPREVDRPQIVVHDGRARAILLEQERWAAPLKDTLPQLLADELDQRVPGTRFVPSGSSAVAVASARLAIDISRFEVSRSQGAVVAAHWTYRAARQGAIPVEGDAIGRSTIAGDGYDALVEALRVSTSRVAEGIAAKLLPIG